MATSMKRLESLGHAVAEAQEEWLVQNDCLPEARARLFRPKERRRSWRPWIVVTGSAAALAGLVLVWALAAADRPVSFVVGDDARKGEVYRWMAAPASGPLPLYFSDGSSLRLERRSSARVKGLDRHGAHLTLEQGSAAVRIAPRAGAHWELEAGPFLVLVVGTQFAVAWDPTTQEFAFSLEHGKVLLRGPVLKERMVQSRESLRVWVSEARMEFRAASDGAEWPELAGRSTSSVARQDRPRPAQTLPPSPQSLVRKDVPKAAPGVARVARQDTPSIAPESAPRIARTDTARVAERSTTGKEEPAPTLKTPKALAPGEATSSSPGPSEQAPPPLPAPTPVDHARPRPAAGPTPWDLARSGHYREAIAAADRLGWAEILSAAQSKQLRTLGDAARLSAEPDLAHTIYRRIRDRFPGSEEAATAAFFLGRIEFDHRRAFSPAAHWFELYLRERPQGPLVQEASGRLIEARRAAGDKAGAGAAARAYLARYPQGPHAELARSLAAY